MLLPILLSTTSAPRTRLVGRATPSVVPSSPPPLDAPLLQACAAGWTAVCPAALSSSREIIHDVFGVANVLVILPMMHWAQLVERSLGSAAVLGFPIGVSSFGTAYMVVHDGVVHSRFPAFGLERVGWIQEVAEAHRAHHKGKMGVPYGLFLGPHELRAAERGVPPDPMPAALKAALVGSTILGVGALCAGV